MRKLLIILFFGAVSIACGKLYYMSSGELLLTENGSNEENYSLEIIETTVIPYQEALNSDSNQINNEIEQAKSSPDLLPHEVPIWNAWAEERGYDLNGHLTHSYNSLSDEILLSLAVDFPDFTRHFRAPEKTPLRISREIARRCVNDV